MEERKGFLTPEQEKKLDRLIELKGVAEALDGPAISLADNQLLERLKVKLEEQYPGASELIYEIVDTIIDAIPEPAEE